MATTRYISSKTIIADFFRDVRPTNSSWAVDAIEWIAQGLASIGGGFNIELKEELVSVENHIGRLPCSYKSIKDIAYNGKVLDKYSNILNIQDYDITEGAFWKIKNDSYIELSFLTGEVIIYYYDTLKEFDTLTGINYPIIPDDGANWVRTFLQEFILMKYLMRGNKHPVRNFKEVKDGIYNRWGAGSGLLERATNSMSFPDVNDMEMLRNSLTGLHTDWTKKVNQWYNTNEDNGSGEVVSNEQIDISFPTP